MPTDEYHLIDEVLTGRMNRRDLIRRLLAAGVSLTAVTGLLTETGIGGVAEAAELAAPAAAPKRGGTAKLATIVPADDVDPVTLYNEGSIFTMEMACEYLCYPRPNYSLAPMLATSWRPNSNGAVWTFNLRKGVKFHNGSTMTADDVVATFDRLTDPKMNSAALSAFKGVLSKGHTKKVSTYVVQFHLDKPNGDFPGLVSAFNYNSVILPKNYTIGEFVKGGVGTGPFILEKYTPKVGATYKKNPHYWASGLPYLDGVQMKYYADNSSIVLAMQAGAIDVHLDMPYQGSQALFGNSNVKILSNPSSAYREFHMRVDQKPFNDVRVRQAVALSINRPQIIQGVLHGYGQFGNDHAMAPIYPTSALAIKDIPQRKQDYVQAKKLLAAAGHPNGIDVTLTTENFLEIPQYAQFIQQQLKGGGIRVKLNIEDQNTYYGSKSNEPWLDVPMGIVDWAARASATQTIVPAYLTGGVWNSAHWSNKTFDKLVAEFAAEPNKAKREQLALQAAKVQHDAVPAVIAYWLTEFRATGKNVTGLAKGPASLLDASRIALG